MNASVFPQVRHVKLWHLNCLMIESSYLETTGKRRRRIHQREEKHEQSVGHGRPPGWTSTTTSFIILNSILLTQRGQKNWPELLWFFKPWNCVPRITYGGVCGKHRFEARGEVSVNTAGWLLSKFCSWVFQTSGGRAMGGSCSDRSGCLLFLRNNYVHHDNVVIIV